MPGVNDMVAWDRPIIRGQRSSVSTGTASGPDSGMMAGMHMTDEELAARLAEAARMQATLRRCTLEWRALGERILSERQGGSERPDHSRAAGS